MADDQDLADTIPRLRELVVSAIDRLKAGDRNAALQQMESLAEVLDDDSDAEGEGYGAQGGGFNVDTSAADAEAESAELDAEERDDQDDEQDDDEVPDLQILTAIHSLVAEADEAINRRGDLGAAARVIDNLRTVLADATGADDGEDAEDEDEDGQRPAPSITRSAPIRDSEALRCAGCNRRYVVARNIVTRTDSHVFTACPRCDHREASEVMAIEMLDGR